MRTIYKYELPFGDETMVQMPKDAVILKAAVQGCKKDSTAYPHICVWALVDTTVELVEWTFRTAGTGHPLPDNVGVLGIDVFNEDSYTYFDSVFDRDFVWHIFYRNAP